MGSDVYRNEWQIEIQSISQHFYIHTGGKRGFQIRSLIILK